MYILHSVCVRFVIQLVDMRYIYMYIFIFFFFFFFFFYNIIIILLYFIFFFKKKKKKKKVYKKKKKGGGGGARCHLVHICVSLCNMALLYTYILSIYIEMYVFI